jgi:hypothetical protein
VEDLHSIIFKLIHHLGTTDHVIAREQNQVAVSLHASDLSRRDDSVTIINEMDLKTPPFE